ncbi:hypothetical protein [Streptomyces sp. NPDC057438]|uniref:hypothetical protein n=1 Tax=Streptomyces sp. NPDC057438 TaxID=3346133 RepID=UPI0036C13CE6
MTSYPAVTLVPSDLVQAATLDVVRHDEWRRTRLHEVATILREGLTSLGYDLRGSGAHVLSLPVGTVDRYSVKAGAGRAAARTGWPPAQAATG